jgi:hypothetical protein
MAPGDRELRWAWRHAKSTPTEPGVSYRPIDGYYMWVAKEDESPETWDPMYAQRRALLAHHPGFRAHIEHLRTCEPASDDQLVAAAEKWQITEMDLIACVEGGDSFDTFGDKILVELRPTEFVVHIPRPLTSARRETLKRWMTDTRHWPQLHEWSGGTEWHKQPDAHLAPDLIARLDWYDRWQAGERPGDIHDSLPPEAARKVPEEVIRNTIQRIHRQLQRISPEGLKSPGP